MSLFPFRRLLVGALGAALTLAVLVSVPGAAPAAAPAAAVDPSQVTVTGLKVNGRTNPLGIPGAAPSFSWHGESAARGVVQTAYQIQVATSAAKLSNPDIWNSNKKTSNRQVDVLYTGAVGLTSQTRYFWRVRTWDGQDHISSWSEVAWFETGMLSPADWGGAKWIGAAPHREAERWHDYTADFTFSLDEGGFGVYFGARNVDYGYMWQISVADGTPRFRPHVKVDGGYWLRANKDISSVISVADLMHGVHTLSVTVDSSTVTTRIDGRIIEDRGTYAGSAQPIKGFVGVRTGLGEDATIHSVKVTADNGGDTLLSTDFSDNNPFGVGEILSAGLELEGPLEGVWQPNDQAMPLLRTEFGSSPTLTRARIYATACGVYQMSLNGQPVGDQHLAPGWTDYRKRVQHQTYDVTDLVRDGTNAWGVELGRGWWAGKLGFLRAGQYGTGTSFLGRLRLDYSDGTTRWVDTNSNWNTRPGPYVATDNLDGESYDARLEQPGWSSAPFDDSGWYDAVVLSADTGTVFPQPDEPVRTTEERTALRRTNPAPGKYVFDLGQNIVGVARMVLHGKAGTTATIRYGEALNPDGTLYTANLRTARATDTYTFDADGTATYEPAFTQHGFQYVEISGTETPSAVGDVTGVVWGSDLAATGSLETSSAMLNQLLSNISWGQRGNFLSIPTDTPARDERLGWTGDINVFAPTASYLRDTRAFFGKWMRDLADTQYPLGEFRAVAPVPPDLDFEMLGGVGWSDAAITVPYSTWLAFGDASVVRQFYPAMKSYLNMARQQWNKYPWGRHAYGDWLNLEDPTPDAVLGTAYLAEDARMMSEMAAAIGQTADATEFSQLSADIRSYFATNLVSADGTVSGNSQTGYAMALSMGLVADGLKAKVGTKFVAKIAASGNHLTTGFLGTPLLLPALSTIGRNDVAWKLLTRTAYPSWGYEVEKGATTMWERWNSIMPDGSFGDVNMNSFNHYAYGAVGDWMYRNIGAIAPAAPGYKKIRIEPTPGGGVDHAEGTYDSVYGTIHTDWNAESETYRVEGQTFAFGTRLDLAVDVPVNTTADVVFPGSSAAWVREGGSVLSEVPGVQAVSAIGGKVTVTVGSGSYHFTSSGVNAWSGAPLEQALQLRRGVATQVGAGTLSSADGADLDALLGILVDRLRAVYAKDATGATPTTEVREAIAAVREVRMRLEAALLVSVQSPSAVADLDDGLAGLEEALSDLLSFYWPVSVSLEPLPNQLPGAVVNARVLVNNASESPITALSGSVRVGKGSIVTFSAASVGGSRTERLPVTLRIPDDAAPGRYDGEVTLAYTAGATKYDLTDVVPITVDSGVQIGAITVTPDSGDPVGRATLKVPVTNTRPVAATLRAVISSSLPPGWKAVRSPAVTVGPGGTATASIPLVVPYDRIGGVMVSGTVAITQSDITTLASKPFTFSLGVAAPPGVWPLDYVMFGYALSEQAHAVSGSASSGTDTLAGYTRRYSHINYPGSWFSANMKVTPGQPFVLRNREVFAGSETRSYQVYVDGILVTTMTTAPDSSAPPGPSSTVYDLLVDTPATLAATQDGKVTVKYLFQPGSPGDPSLAESWVLPVPADTLAPLVASTVTSGVKGDPGWYRSGVQVRFDAVDNGSRSPTLWIQRTPELSDTPEAMNPVSTSATGQGTNVLYYWASTGTHNYTPSKTVVIRIDSVAPTTQADVVNTTPGQATLRFYANDATSGALETLYRIDGGAWKVINQTTFTTSVAVTGAGQHTVEYTTTDRAGNHEVKRTTTFTVAGP